MQKTQVTIKHIAQSLNISISTVSRALQNHPRIGLRTKEKVFEMAQRLNYVPNPAAILLKKNKTYTIGVVLPHLQEEFFSQAITAIEDVISAENYNVVVSQSRDKLERENRAIKSFISSRVDGVIASISAETTQYYQFRELEKYGIPIVFFDRAPKDVAVNKVRGNIADAAFEVIDFLAKKGIKKVFVSTPGFTSDCLETIDEIGHEAKEVFVEAGGEELFQCPCLNDHPAWIEAMKTIVDEEGAGWL